MAKESRWQEGRQRIVSALAKLLREKGWPAGTDAIAVEPPSEPGHGDLSTNLAFRLAGRLRRAPREIAAELVAGWPQEEIAQARAEGAGFVNFTLDTAWLSRVVEQILEDPNDYGSAEFGRGQRVLMEFVSANPTGPLVVVNGRSAAVGDTLARAFRLAGFEADREYYVNDAGNQIHKLGHAMALRLRELKGDPIGEWPEGVYPGAYVRDLAEQYRRECGREEASEAEYDALGNWAADKIRASHEAELARFGVSFERWFSERELRESNAPQAVLEQLRERGYLETREGAEWFLSQQLGDDKDRVMVKSDGSLTYFVPDAAYHAHKFERGYDWVIDLLGPDHHGYIARLQALVEALGYPRDRLEILIIQLVRLMRGGEPVRMSKRGGQFVTLGELIDEVGADPARWFFLERAPNTPMDFNLDLAELKSNENPVFYVQYAGARIKSLLRQASDPAAPFDLRVLTSPEERALLVLLAQFPQWVVRVAADRAPQYLPRYLTDLAGAFHAFYRQHRILDAPAPEGPARLALARAVLAVLAQGTGLMGVSLPDSM